MVLAINLGFTIQVDSSARCYFDSLHRKVTSSGYGSLVSIFGIHCSFCGDDSEIDGTTTHNAVWNSEAGIFSVIPNNSGGFVIVVGHIGEKMKVAD